MPTKTKSKKASAAPEVREALAEEKANQEQIGATVQVAKASATRRKPSTFDIAVLEHRNNELRGVIKIRERQLDALQAQRDELLSFVRKVNAHLGKHSGTVDVKTACKWSDESDAAIARATEGGQS